MDSADLQKRSKPAQLLADKIAGADVTFEITDGREISGEADEKLSDIHKSTQKASELPSVHHVPFNDDFGKQVAARRQGNHSITRISVGGRGVGWI